MKQSNAIHTRRKQPTKPLLKPRKPTYEYHWGRIFTGMATLLVIAGVVYGLLSWFAPSPEEGLDRVEIPPKEMVGMEDQQSGGESDPNHLAIEDTARSFTHAEQETSPAQVAGATEISPDMQSEQISMLEEPLVTVDNPVLQTESKPLENLSPTSEMLQATGVHTTAREEAEEIITNAIDLGDSESATAAQLPEEINTLPSEDEHSEPQAEIPEKMPLERPDEGSDNADETNTADTADSSLQLKQNKIIEPSVKRFLLARTVSNREPLGELNDIRFNAEGSAVVWAYSEVIDMKGSQFNYVWSHDGNQLATVRVNVRGNRWRSYSSKVINQSMSGSWRVEMQDGEGRLMASADFFLE